MLAVKNLTKDFTMHIRDGKKVDGFREISFLLSEGEMICVTGPSGKGKSSLLKCIYRTYLPTAGEILYTNRSGKVINLASTDDNQILELRQNEISSVSQFFQVIPRISAFDTIMNTLDIREQDEAWYRKRAAELLTRLGIPESLWDMYPSTFSGGEKQRLNIIQAIIRKPRLLLLDEPTASLDPITKKEVVSLLLELKAQGTAMLGVFHDYEVIKRVADQEFDIVMGKEQVSYE